MKLGLITIGLLAITSQASPAFAHGSRSHYSQDFAPRPLRPSPPADRDPRPHLCSGAHLTVHRAAVICSLYLMRLPGGDSNEQHAPR
jgi:hypothetical protein